MEMTICRGCVGPIGSSPSHPGPCVRQERGGRAPQNFRLQARLSHKAYNHVGTKAAREVVRPDLWRDYFTFAIEQTPGTRWSPSTSGSTRTSPSSRTSTLVNEIWIGSSPTTAGSTASPGSSPSTGCCATRTSTRSSTDVSASSACPAPLPAGAKGRPPRRPLPRALHAGLAQAGGRRLRRHRSRPSATSSEAGLVLMCSGRRGHLAARGRCTDVCGWRTR